jgi:hypothetical protein
VMTRAERSLGNTGFRSESNGISMRWRGSMRRASGANASDPAIRTSPECPGGVRRTVRPPCRTSPDGRRLPLSRARRPSRRAGRRRRRLGLTCR